MIGSDPIYAFAAMTRSAHGAQRLVRVHVAERAPMRGVGRVRQKVVARDDTKRQPAVRAFDRRHREYRIRAAPGFTPPAFQSPSRRDQESQEECFRARERSSRAYSHFRVALFLLLQNRHRDFGEIVEL